MARCSQHDVFRLDVVMNDTRIVYHRRQGALCSDGRDSMTEISWLGAGVFAL
jgi:hypothetical protein